MSEARRYQQLRGHLSYLKLNDAAEALPRVLDQARAGRMTLTGELSRGAVAPGGGGCIRGFGERAGRLGGGGGGAALGQVEIVGTLEPGAQPGVQPCQVNETAQCQWHPECEPRDTVTSAHAFGRPHGPDVLLRCGSAAPGATGRWGCAGSVDVRPAEPGAGRTGVVPWNGFLSPGG
ncbi:predicted protein [Streptomyces sp. C]|nr:predicted protein [Streptomyces sp. C]